MKIVSLVTDAFGGSGGIALYNRDLLTALSNYSKTSKLVAIPRQIPNKPEEIPEKLRYYTDGVGGKLKYIKTIIRYLSGPNKIDLVLCGHINLLPVAYLVSRWKKAPMIMMIYGIDAWENPNGLLTKILVKKVDMVISISAITRDRFLLWSEYPKEKVHLLPNAIHTEKYGVAPKSKRYEKRYGVEGKKVIMTLGRMSSHERYKGFDQVIEILSDLFYN